MSTIEFERLLISKIDDIREAGDGKITRAAINKALEVADDDEETIESIRKKLRSSKCIKGRGRYYTFLVEEIIEPDEDLIASDPELSSMAIMVKGIDAFTSKRTPVAPKWLEIKCKHCKCWSREEKTCSEKEGRHLGVNDACSDGFFLFNPASLYRKRRK